MRYVSRSRRAFLYVNGFLLALLGAACFAPVLNAVAVSFSGSVAIGAGKVTFWPVDFNLDSYRYILSRSEFFSGLLVTLKRLAIGTALQMLITVFSAFPLSMEKRDFHFRTVYVWFFVFTMLFGSGLVPWYLQIKSLGLLDSIWALVLPGAVSVYNIILVLNFFRGLPRDLSEAFYVDGANHHHVLWRLYLPVSMPSVATILLFTMVAHWNEWFNGLILMNHTENYPLATYLYTIVQTFDYSNVSQESAELLAKITTRSAKCAQIVVAIIPIVCVYPFLQRYFVKGIVLGSVKG